jgi:hypothetical protein
MREAKQYKANLNNHKPHYTEVTLKDLLELLNGELDELVKALKFGEPLEICLEAADCELILTKIAAKMSGLDAWEEFSK